jgi:flagellin
VSFSLNTNITSLQAQNNLNASSAFQSKTINRVTSGLRIVNSGDDAAGLAIANGFRSDQAVLTQGIRNANDGLSTLQTIDGGMNNISLLLDRARTLSAQSASGTFSGDRTLLNSEFQSVVGEISRQAQAIGMNTGGEFAKSLSVFVGGGKDTTGLSNNAVSVANGSVNVDLSHSAVDSQALGLSTYTAQGAATTLGAIQAGSAGFGNVMNLTFRGAGYENGVTVSALNMNTATSMSDVVADINTAIGVASSAGGAGASAFKAANLVASLDTTGTKVVLSSANAAFTVADDTGPSSPAADAVLGTGFGGQLESQGDQHTTLAFGAAVLTAAQDMTISMTDSTGKLISATVHLLAGDNVGASITKINAALKIANNDLSKLVATAPTIAGTSVEIMGGQGFSVFTSTNGTPGIGFAQGATTASSANGTAGNTDISTQAGAAQAVNALVNAVGTLGAAQAAVGKGENNFNYAMNLAQSQSTNLAAAESRIRDADLAAEAANLTKAQILVQAGTAALAQANSAPQAILALLK